ncbi:MAG: enterotoxin [Terracidiphilus sp.]
MKIPVFVILLFATLFAFAGDAPGRAAKSYELRGDRLTARFQVTDGGIKVTEVEDRSSRAKLRPVEAFSLKLRDGRVITASQLKMNAAPVEKQVAPNPSAARHAEQVAGRSLCADLSTQDNSLAVHWCAVLRDNTNYLRQEITLRALEQPVDIAEVRLFDFEVNGARVVGKVAGSPIVAGDFFFGFESPLSASEVKGDRATAVLTRILPLGAGQSITYSSVIGVAAPGQLRRDFLAYIEEERAHPYRTFLHYNSWFDLSSSANERYDEAQVLDRVRAIGEELVRKRGVVVDSFLLDDGWDDTHSLWEFNPGLPNGLTDIRKAAAEYGFGVGVWLSPWGGYDVAKEQRIAAGERAGLETVKGGFALSAPRYYSLFEKTCLGMISKYGVNQFKIDGTGNATQVFPGSIFDSDFSAAIHLIDELRLQDPNIYINVTTGTLPSPFWLRYSDDVVRGGDDYNFAGVGSWRQKWITYRDEVTYHNIVKGGPLFPLSSLMLDGVIYAEKVKYTDLHRLATSPVDLDPDLVDEVHTYFGGGTQLQELYITPSLLTSKDWDILAEAARWSRANAAVLKDTHWIGGDPGKLEVYGWASWNVQKGIVVLRNPSDHAQEFSLDVGKAFELPRNAPQSYKAHSPWVADESLAPINLRAGHPHRFMLEPLQVITLEAEPLN